LERNCWYCHKPLPLTKLLKRNLFCSSDHEERYFDEQSTAAFERMKEPEPAKLPAVLEVKPPEVEQAPAENHPPMAPYLKPEIFARDMQRLAIALEDPLQMLAELAEPAQPIGPLWQIKPELAPVGQICEGSAAPSAMAHEGSEFPSAPFSENKRDITGHLEQSGLANSLRCAPYVPLWNGRATGEAVPSAISAEASSPTPVSARIAAGATRLQGNLSSTAAACSWGLRAPAEAPLAPLEFESSLAFTGLEIQGGPGTWKPSPPRPGASGALTKGLTTPPKDAACHPDFPAQSQETAVHFSKGRTSAGCETPALSPRGWMENTRPVKPVGVPHVAVSGTHEHSPAATIRPVHVPPSACRLAAARFRETQTGLVERREVDSIKSAELTPTGRIATPWVRHDVPPLLPREWTLGAWEHTHPASRVDHMIDSIAPAELTSTGRIAIPLVRHDVPLSVPCQWTRGAWGQTRPAEFGPASPPSAVSTSELNLAVTFPQVGEPRGACRPLSGNFHKTLPGAVDCRRVDSLKPYVSHTFIRTADVRPASTDALAGVAALKFAGPTDQQRQVVDSPVPRLALTGRLEANPGSMTAEPHTVRPTESTLHIGGRIDPRSRPIRAREHSGNVPCLDRQSELPCRIPLADPGKLEVSTVRAGAMALQIFAGCDDAATAPRVAPVTAIRVQPASLFAPPAASATVAFGWARRTLASNRREFLAQRSFVIAPLQTVPQSSGQPARPAVTVNRFPVIRIPRSAPCFALELQLQTVPYRRGQRIRL
jgi:hypothetical protein